MASRIVQFLSSLPRLWNETSTSSTNIHEAMNDSTTVSSTSCVGLVPVDVAPSRRFYLQWTPSPTDVEEGRYPVSGKIGVVLFPVDLIADPVGFLRLKGESSSVVILKDRNETEPDCPYLELEVRVVGAENRYIQWREGGKYHENEK